MVWVIGSKGMLGSEIIKQLENNQISFIGTDIEVDITNPAELSTFATQNSNINWIINCAAYTNVDMAESEIELAEKINATGAENIAKVAKEISAKMIHISTDYVFDGKGKTPYTEIMKTNPTGIYGKTKEKGEKLVLQELPEAYIFRTAWLYGPRGKNFVYTMVNLMNSKEEISVVKDQIGSPTCTLDLARYIIAVIFGGQEIPGNPHPNVYPGIYHCSGEGESSWYDFACEIYKIGREKRIITKECTIKPCSTEDFGSRAPRPAYSVLSKSKLKKALQIKIPHWKESLRAFMASPMFKDN